MSWVKGRNGKLERVGKALTLIELLVSTAIILILSALIVSGFFAFVKFRITSEKEGKKLRFLRMLQTEFSTNLRRAVRGSLDLQLSGRALYFSVGEELYAYKFVNGQVFKSTDGGATWRELPEIKGIDDLSFQVNSAKDLVEVNVKVEGRSYAFLFAPRVVKAESSVWLSWKWMIPVEIRNDKYLNLGTPLYWIYNGNLYNAIDITNSDTTRPLVNKVVAVIVSASSYSTLPFEDPYNIIPVIYNSTNIYKPSDILEFWVGGLWRDGFSFGWWTFYTKKALVFIKIPYIPPGGRVRIVFFRRPSQVPNHHTRDVLKVLGDYGNFNINGTVARGSWACYGGTLTRYLNYFDPPAYFASIQDYRDTDPATVRIKVKRPSDLCMGVEKYNGRTNGRWNISYIGLRSGVHWFPYLYGYESSSGWITSFGIDLIPLKAEVSQFWTTNSYMTYYYLRSYSSLPLHYHHLETYYGSDPSHTRADMDTSSPYTFTRIKIEELSDTPHTLERVAYLNLEPLSFPRLSLIHI